MPIKVPRLILSRHGVFCLRILYADPITNLRREKRVSLGTKLPMLARLIALRFNTAFEERAMTKKTIADLLAEHIHQYKINLPDGTTIEAKDAEDHKLAMDAWKTMSLQEAMNQSRRRPPNILDVQATAPVRVLSKKISEVFKLYLEEKKHDNAKSTLYDKGRLLDEFTKIMGDLEIDLYRKPELVAWKTHEMNKGIGASRINKRLGALNDFFKFAINNGYAHHETSPVEGLLISSKSKLAKKSEHWLPFSDDDLKAIFSQDFVKQMKKPDHYWVPLIALFTGGRLNEIAGLEIKRIRIIDGVHAIEMTDTKTSKIGRTVPIHKDLLALGFWDYVEHVRQSGETLLFPYLTDGKNGYGKNAARQFALWLDKLGITDRLKVFHSFRPTLITRLHNANANAAHAMQITGHEGQQVQNIHFQVYTHSMGLSQLRDTINTVSFPINFALVSSPLEPFATYLAKEKAQAEWEERRAKKRNPESN
jgi:integrase